MMLVVIPDNKATHAVYKTGKPVTYAYDYAIKDHLGNVRMILCSKSDTANYVATMETAASVVENALFSNIENTRTAISGIAGYPTDNTTNPNAYVAKLNAVALNGQKIGPSLVLRVMAGDTIQIGTTAVYRSTAANTSSTTSSNMVSAILNAFSGTGVVDGIHDAGGAGSVLNAGLTSTVYDGLKQKDPNQNLSAKPKAYLNFALFDDQFALVDDNSGVRQVQGDPNVLQPLAVSRMTIKKTGFLYIYSSNESGDDVLFDNLVVTHNSGPIVEETHYYPFGLTMEGISSHALKGLNYPENRFKYNGIEQIGDLGLEDYDAKLRELDPQIGRWWQIDPKIEDMEMWSPYVSNYDNPIRYDDFLGDEPDQRGAPKPGPAQLSKETLELLSKVWKNAVGAINTTTVLINQNINPVYLAVNGAQAFFTKQDILTGQKMNSSDALISVASVVPIGKAAGMMERGFIAAERTLAGDAGRVATREISQDVASVATKVPTKGRLGNAATKQQIYDIGTELEGRGYKIKGGGGRKPEEYLPPAGGGRKGGSYIDITAQKNGRMLRINTVDTRKNGTPTTRELINALRIRLQEPLNHLLLIPKK